MISPSPEDSKHHPDRRRRVPRGLLRRHYRQQLFSVNAGRLLAGNTVSNLSRSIANLSKRFLDLAKGAHHFGLELMPAVPDDDVATLLV